MSGLTLTLGTVAVKAGGPETGKVDLPGQSFGAVFGAGKDQYGIGVGLSEQCQQQGRLQMLGNRVESMCNGMCRLA